MTPICRQEPGQDGSPLAGQGWLTACACPPPHARGADSDDRPHQTPRLTQQHKRELATLAAAAVVSTTITLAPIVYQEAPEPSILEASAIAVAEVGLPDPPDTTARFTAVRAQRLQRARGRRAAPAATVALIEGSQLAAGALEEIVPARDSFNGSNGSADQSQRGGLARVLLGSGRYRVQPFPQPSGTY